MIALLILNATLLLFCNIKYIVVVACVTEALTYQRDLDIPLAGFSLPLANTIDTLTGTCNLQHKETFRYRAEMTAITLT